MAGASRSSRDEVPVRRTIPRGEVEESHLQSRPHSPNLRLQLRGRVRLLGQEVQRSHSER